MWHLEGHGWHRQTCWFILCFLWLPLACFLFSTWRCTLCLIPGRTALCPQGGLLLVTVSSTGTACRSVSVPTSKTLKPCRNSLLLLIPGLEKEQMDPVWAGCFQQPKPALDVLYILCTAGQKGTLLWNSKLFNSQWQVRVCFSQDWIQPGWIHRSTIQAEKSI